MDVKNKHFHHPSSSCGANMYCKAPLFIIKLPKSEVSCFVGLVSLDQRIVASDGLFHDIVEAIELSTLLHKKHFYVQLLETLHI
jgi:hypothetical protein